MRNRFAAFYLPLLLTAPMTPLWGAPPIVIAHRGASGYLPEHTLPAKVMAHAMGADYIEQDVVLTRDDVPIVLHDIHLDRVTDVASKFPGRAREDGRYYAIDFSWDEIRTLNVTERLNNDGTAVFPSRFPIRTGEFRVPSLEDELIVIAGLNTSTGRTAGIYPEIKQPAFHRREGKDISTIVLHVLSRHGYRTKDDAIYLQCFEADELRRIRAELKCSLKLVQLLSGKEWSADTANREWLATELAQIAKYADGVGPSLAHLVSRGPDENPRVSPLIRIAHQLRLQVHPWTLRADDVPRSVDSFEQLHAVLLDGGIDGAFSDFPDVTARLFAASKETSR